MPIRYCQSKNCFKKLKRNEGDICDICKIKKIHEERSISKVKNKNNMEEEKTTDEETTTTPEEGADAGAVGEPETTETEETKEEETA